MTDKLTGNNKADQDMQVTAAVSKNFFTHMIEKTLGKKNAELFENWVDKTHADQLKNQQEDNVRSDGNESNLSNKSEKNNKGTNLLNDKNIQQDSKILNDADQQGKEALTEKDQKNESIEEKNQQNPLEKHINQLREQFEKKHEELGTSENELIEKRRELEKRFDELRDKHYHQRNNEISRQINSSQSRQH